MCRHVGVVTCLLVCMLTRSQGWHLYGNRQSDERLNYQDQRDERLNRLYNDLVEYKKQSNDYQQVNQPINDEDMNKALNKIPENDQLFEGDMVMDNRLREAVLGISKKSVVTGDVKWPNQTLVYEIDANFVNVPLLKEGIHEFETRTCIRFKLRTNEPDYVYYTSKENVCSSNIGKVGGKQEIHIGKDCMVLGTIIHETMHALGFIHEHSRPDRDEYLKVNWENIEKDEWSNFNKYSGFEVSDENVGYNFASLMHYRNDAFTMNGKDTLIAKGDESLKFGQRIKFSVGDVRGINRFYQCHAYLDTPNYNGLFKDYSGVKDEHKEKEKRLENVLNKFRDRFYDRKMRRGYY
ncbi:zinc metalloproteinase nas-4-like [Clytia hemisphaerica]|uniref:Metalloendopeptidase n=1 Tax=Clytia hemisphaerica TaxID=252671 RepID=A0A7M5V1Z7_9CNID